MKEKPTTPVSEEEAQLALMVAYLRELQKNEFYGVVELTFQKGELKVSRETRSRPVAALASDIWPQVPQKARPALKEKLKEHKGFVVD